MEYLETRDVLVKIVVNNQNAIERCVNDEDGWRTRMFYNLSTEQEVLDHWTYNCIANGVEDVSRLDGWADLERGEVTMHIMDVY